MTSPGGSFLKWVTLRVARFFLVQHTKKAKYILKRQNIYQKGKIYTKKAKYIPKRQNIYQITIKYTKWPQNKPYGRKIDQMVIKYTNIFHYNTLQNLPKLEFLV
jgi:hypothetical protein